MSAARTRRPARSRRSLRGRPRGGRRRRFDPSEVETVLRDLPITEAEALHDGRRFLAVREAELAALRTNAGTTGEPKVVAFTWTDGRSD